MPAIVLNRHIRTITTDIHTRRVFLSAVLKALTDRGVPVDAATLRVLLLGQTYLMLPGQTGVILAAPPRSGKGVSCVVPNLLNWPGSVLVLDIKKENWTLTAGYRSLFSDVYLFDPFAADGRAARWRQPRKATLTCAIFGRRRLACT
jgi:Type IV secretory system Conjugative DNA transfer